MGKEVRAEIVTVSGERRRLPLNMSPIEDGFVMTLSREALCEPVETVDFIPDFATAQEGEAGYIALENRLLRFCGHEDAVYDVGYGMLRYVGMKTPRGCFICIFTQGWEQHEIVVKRENGVYSAHARFRLNGQSPETDLQVTYHFLSDDRADYSGMAAVYREEMRKSGMIRPFSERNEPGLRYVLHAPEVRIRMGWKPVPTPTQEQTVENEPPMHAAITFDGVAELMERCKVAGLTKAEFCLVGWNVRGHDGRWPQALPVEPALGGEEALRRLIAQAKALGYQIVCHTNATDCYHIADVWSEKLPMRDRAGDKKARAQWSGGRMYDICPVSGGEQYTMDTLEAVKALGFEGIHYIDVVGTVPPRRCFAPEHPCSESAYVASMRRIARQSRALIGGYQSEGGYDFLADVLDMSLYLDFHIFDQPHPLCDDNVPVWQMVYHDCILSNAGPTTVNYVSKPWQNRLKYFEYGGHPVMYIYSKFKTGDYWMGEDDYTCDTPQETERTVQALLQMQEDEKRVWDLREQRMTAHRREGTLAVVTYENGAHMVCNYGETAVSFEGVTIAPHEFEVIRG